MGNDWFDIVSGGIGKQISQQQLSQAQQAHYAQSHYEKLNGIGSSGSIIAMQSSIMQPPKNVHIYSKELEDKLIQVVNDLDRLISNLSSDALYILLQKTNTRYKLQNIIYKANSTPATKI